MNFLQIKYRPEVCTNFNFRSSCEMKLNLDYLKDELWEHLNLIRVYTKKPGSPPDFDDSIILRNGVTVKHVCHAIHRTLPAVFKYALVWVSTPFEIRTESISNAF